MLTLITGVPGAGKTAAAVDLILREYEGRPLYVDGLNGLQVPHVPCDVLKWPEDVPDGSVVVVDEVQRKWRPRGPGSKVPESVAALETHRHRGLDFILITQSPKLLDSNVRGLVGRHVHLRDTGFLGRWWYEWPECNVDLAWRSCLSKHRYKLPRKVFSLYKSASMHIKPVRRFPKLVIVLGVLAVAFVAFAGWSYKKVQSNLHSAEVQPAMTGSAPAVGSLSGQSVSGQVLSVPDERVAFVPRIGGRPWTAPAYDGLRKVDKLPIITGAICMGEVCKCYSGTQYLPDLSAAQCKQWLDDPPYQPYKVITGEPEGSSRPASQQQRDDQPVKGVELGSSVG